MGGLTARAAVLDTWPAACPWVSLTLMSSGPAAIEAGQRARIRLLLEVLPVMGKEAVWREMHKLEGRAEAPPEVAAFLHRRWLTTTDAQLLTTGRQLIGEPDRVDELAGVPLPVLLLSGTSDYAWPVPWQDDMARRLAGRRVVIPGCDHSPNVEDPAATAQALLAGHGRHRVTQGDALVEGGEHAEFDLPAEGGLADQQAGHRTGGVHVVVGEHPDGLQLVVIEQVGVDDQDGDTAPLGVLGGRRVGGLRDQRRAGKA
jgi:hypothetical protein